MDAGIQIGRACCGNDAPGGNCSQCHNGRSPPSKIIIIEGVTNVLDSALADELNGTYTEDTTGHEVGDGVFSCVWFIHSTTAQGPGVLRYTAGEYGVPGTFGFTYVLLVRNTTKGVDDFLQRSITVPANDLDKPDCFSPQTQSLAWFTPNPLPSLDTGFRWDNATITFTFESILSA